MPGLLIGGLLFDVPGATVMSPGDEPWLARQDRDGRKRRPTDPAMPHQATCHTTAGKTPHIIKPGSPTYDHVARIRRVCDDWRIGPRGALQSGGAHVVVCGKTIGQIADLAAVIMYHATKCNDFSFGVEMVQEQDGTIHEDTINTTVDLFFVACDVLGIPAFTPSTPYRKGKIIERLRYGGPDAVGWFGHCDNAWMFPEWFPAICGDDTARLAYLRKTYPNGYADRSEGDPGPEWRRRIKARGALAFDYDVGEDLEFTGRVQRALNERYGESLKVDRVWGQKTTAAMRRHGLWNGGVFPEFPVP